MNARRPVSLPRLRAQATHATHIYFSEEVSPIRFESRRKKAIPPPPEEAIFEALRKLTHALVLPPEVLVAGLIYAERLNRDGVRQYVHSWRPIILGSLMLADKMWREAPGSVGRYAAATPMFSPGGTEK